MIVLRFILCQSQCSSFQCRRQISRLVASDDGYRDSDAETSFNLRRESDGRLSRKETRGLKYRRDPDEIVERLSKYPCSVKKANSSGEKIMTFAFEAHRWRLGGVETDLCEIRNHTLHIDAYSANPSARKLPLSIDYDVSPTG
ncbi:unnamed protein product [Strongylus vulgaris]|uniref:Uncharacterized protein n=1 Tax=Strongylus vulgaris TaxID=40348 RepID=A0A3P7ILI6_STRVU|nr:unnamed protein product [Strongylus vulgaris]